MRSRNTKRDVATRLRASGSSWAEVARLAGYADSATAHRAVRAALKAREDSAYKELEEVETLRREISGTVVGKGGAR